MNNALDENKEMDARKMAATNGEWNDEARAALLISHAKGLQRTIARQRETLRRVVKEARRQRAETTEMLGAISAAQEEMHLDRMQQVFGNAACAAGPWITDDPAPRDGREILAKHRDCPGFWLIRWIDDGWVVVGDEYERKDIIERDPDCWAEIRETKGQDT